MPGLLDRSRCIAPLNYDRWRVPPAALAIQLSIGQVYAFSVFDVPLSRLIGATESAPGDWTLASIGGILTVAIVVLGLSAFTLGRWVENAGPRKALVASASCFGGGFLVAALGVQLHELWLVYLGYGVIGGIGLGIGCVSPISTLIKWFPDRPGMSTGLAIVGFGAGAMLGSSLAVALMQRFATATNTGVAMTFVAMGVIYLALMMFGAFTVRLPAPEWQPESFTSRLIVEPGSGPRAPRLGSLAGRSVAERKEPAPDVHVNMALKTKQFWLIWVAIFLLVTAGIGALSVVAPLMQEVFPFTISAREAAGFLALLGLADVAGRFAWSWSSDSLGRRRLYTACFAVGAALCAFVAASGSVLGIVPFVAACVVLVSLYGGGLAAIPGYVRDTFGVLHLGAIYGRLLTAWAAAAIAGPAIVSYLRESQVAKGGDAGEAYAITLNLAAGLLVAGLVANSLVSPVAPKYQISPPSGFRV